MKFLCHTTFLTGLVFLAGCSDSKVILQASNGGKQLVYDCDNFKPQVETPEDLRILVKSAAETLSAAAAEQSMVTVTEIDDAINKSDWRRLERAVVMYRGSHKKK